MSIKRYSELVLLPSFEERFAYLKLDGRVGDETFGFRRWVNQKFYRSDAWLRFRDEIIIRDMACDLGVAGYEIHGSVLVHHLNPIKYEDILHGRECVFDPENVICVSHATHNAIHYGNENILQKTAVERERNDTCPWKKGDNG